MHTAPFGLRVSEQQAWGREIFRHTSRPEDKDQERGNTPKETHRPEKQSHKTSFAEMQKGASIHKRILGQSPIPTHLFHRNV